MLKLFPRSRTSPDFSSTIAIPPPPPVLLGPTCEDTIHVGSGVRGDTTGLSFPGFPPSEMGSSGALEERLFRRPRWSERPEGGVKSEMSTPPLALLRRELQAELTLLLEKLALLLDKSPAAMSPLMLQYRNITQQMISQHSCTRTPHHTDPSLLTCSSHRNPTLYDIQAGWACSAQCCCSCTVLPQTELAAA